MATKIFVNLPIKNLNRSVEFFTKLGYTFNAKFTNESATCMVISDTIFVMLLMEKHFQNFTKKEIVNAKQTTEVIIALDAASREEVDTMVKNAVAAGGSIYREPDDYGWMYSHSFEDLDGHQWEILYMNESQMPQK